MAIFSLNACSNHRLEADVGALLMRVCGIEVAEMVLQGEFEGAGFDRVGQWRLSVDDAQRSLENFSSVFARGILCLARRVLFPGDFVEYSREKLMGSGGVRVAESVLKKSEPDPTEMIPKPGLSGVVCARIQRPHNGSLFYSIDWKPW